MIPPEKQSSLDWIDANRSRLSSFQREIWEYAETAFREYKSARAYCELLRREGFTVEEGSGGMPTAFKATWGGGRPVLGSFAEYDATPENSQQPVPYRAPRKGLHPMAPGHTDPHSALGVAALTGILGAKAAMERHRLPGTLVLFGEPAEKVCGSKPVHAAKGYYDGADAYVVFHPNPANTTAWETQFGSYWSALFTFESADPESWIDHAALPLRHAHAGARSPGALDAACLMYTSTRYMKDSMFPATGNWTLSEFMMVGGQCTADNLPPSISQIQYAWRSPSLGLQDRIARILENNARRVADMTNCQVDLRWITKTRVALPNLALARIVYRNLEMVGPPMLNARAVEFARAIQQNLGFAPMDEPFIESCQRLLPPEENEANLRRGLPPWQHHFAADDYVEYTWHAPTARLYCGRPNLKAPRANYEYPAWVRNAIGGMPDCIDPMTFAAGRTIACSLVDLVMNAEGVDAARAEFTERTGGGVGGSKWVGPLLPRDFPPPIDLRWPEYVTTPRGEEWWIPTPMEGATP